MDFLKNKLFLNHSMSYFLNFKTQNKFIYDLKFFNFRFKYLELFPLFQKECFNLLFSMFKRERSLSFFFFIIIYFKFIRNIFKIT